MSQMPAFLQPREPRPEAETGEAAPKPRRRRAPRASEPSGAEES